MWWRAFAGAAALLVSGAVSTSGQGGPELSFGAGPVLPAGGWVFESRGSLDDVAAGLNAALRWRIRNVATAGIVVEWARFPPDQPSGYSDGTLDGMRRYLTFGVGVRRYSTSNAAIPRWFLGAGLGVARERWQNGQICGSADPPGSLPCEAYSDRSGGWWGWEFGVAMPVASDLAIEAAATLSGVNLRKESVLAVVSYDADASWIGIRLGVVGVLW